MRWFIFSDIFRLCMLWGFNLCIREISPRLASPDGSIFFWFSPDSVLWRFKLVLLFSNELWLDCHNIFMGLFFITSNSRPIETEGLPHTHTYRDKFSWFTFTFVEISIFSLTPQDIVYYLFFRVWRNPVMCRKLHIALIRDVSRETGIFLYTQEMRLIAHIKRYPHLFLYLRLFHSLGTFGDFRCV